MFELLEELAKRVFTLLRRLCHDVDSLGLSRHFVKVRSRKSYPFLVRAVVKVLRLDPYFALGVAGADEKHSGKRVGRRPLKSRKEE